MAGGFKVVNSGGMWEVYSSPDGIKWGKINAAVSTIEEIEVTVKADGHLKMEVKIGEYKNLGCRDRYESA